MPNLQLNKSKIQMASCMKTKQCWDLSAKSVGISTVNKLYRKTRIL